MTRRFCAWALLGMVWVASGCNSDARHLAEVADAQWREGNYEEAVRINRALYERDPQGRLAPQALMNIGNISYLNLRRIKDAVDAYQKLVEEFPGRPEELKAHLQLADIYEHEVRDFTEAVAEYDRILEAPGLDNRLEIEFKRANGYFKMEDYNRALRELRRIEEAGVSGHLADQVFLKIGNIYQIQRRYEEASVYLQRVEQSPCPECRHNAILCLAETYEAVFDIPLAIETIRKLDHSAGNDQRVSQEIARLTEKQRRLGNSEMTWTPAPPPRGRPKAPAKPRKKQSRTPAPVP